MPSADFCGDLDASLETTSPWASPQISQGKARDLPPIHPPPIRQIGSNDIGFESFGPLAHPSDASYAIRIPRARSLPAASFRSRVIPDTLAVRPGVPVIKASIGTFTRQVTSWVAFAYQLSSVRS